MFSKVYFLNTTSKVSVWIPYVSQMVLLKKPFTGKKDYMLYKFTGWSKESVLCVSSLFMGSETIDHAKIIDLAIKADFVTKDATDDTWGVIGVSGKIISWESLCGKTEQSIRIPTANCLGLGVEITRDE